MGMSGEEASIQSLLKAEEPFLAYSEDRSKIVCILNNHELPVKLHALESFVRGKKYQRLKKNKSIEDWIDEYRPFLAPSINYPNMMFCALTNHLIKKSKASVEEHLRGKKFAKAKERFQNDLGELYEEPTIEEMEAAIQEMEEEEEEEEGSLEFVEEDFEVDAGQNEPTSSSRKRKLQEEINQQTRKKM